MARPIPTSMEELTPEWLTDALRSRRVIADDAEIVSREIEELGSGEGFAGELARLTLRYGTGAGPATLVAKIPTSIEENRNGSELLGVYERELRMYEEVLDSLDVEVPGLYYADIEMNPRAERLVANVRRIDRLPIWMLRVLLWLMDRFGAPDTFPSVLLLEDLAPAEIGDQVAGCDIDRASVALGALARLHASTWGDARPPETYWLTSFDVAPRLLQAGLLNARRGFVANFGHLLSEHTRAVFERARNETLDRTRRLGAGPACLLHGDFRLDNMFFTASGDVRALIDWQLANLGPPMTDVVYFICGSIDPEVSEHEVDALLVGYHGALVAAGVDDYPLERVRVDYDDALQLLLARMASVDMLDFGQDRGVHLVDEWLRRLDARVARVPV